jgi:hypothetical protein
VPLKLQWLLVDRETSNWVMVVLERAGVVELDRRRPITARLVHGF